MEKSNVFGIGTILGSHRGNCFRMPARRHPHPERLVRSPRPTLEQLISKVTVGTSHIPHQRECDPAN